MPRLFIGLEPPPDFRDALAVLQGRIQAAGVTGRFLDPANLHLTLAFIGMWTEDVSALLPPVPAPFPLSLASLGVFPEAKVLWVGVSPSQALNSLAGEVRQRLTAAGVPFDQKAFYPHITLLRKPVLPEALRLDAIQIPPAEMTVSSVCLYRSDHTEAGMAYTVIGRSGAK